MPVEIIALAELCERMNLGLQPILVDVRTPGEFRRTHAPEAVSVPLDRLDPASIAKDCRSSDGRIYVLCQSGTRAAQASEKLLAAGLEDVLAVQGGMKAWKDAGLPQIVGRSGTVSLERQVRIAAGSLVLLGCLLAWLVKPQFIGLAAFIGAGLIFAGITDICGMAMLLAKLPWNSHDVP